MTKSRGVNKPKAIWTDSALALLVAEYPDTRTEDLALRLGMRLGQVYGKASAMGLKKSEAFMATPASGRTNGRQGVGTRFPKGNKPWNKGQSYHAPGRAAETQFKEGQQPYNTLPVGAYRLSKDGALQQKIGDRRGNSSVRWRGVHELVWTAANGPLPPKHIVVFKPGRRTAVLEEITLDAVECISLAENMRRNTRHNLPKELSDLIQLRGAITRQINRRTKNGE
ncbi:MAG: HNH endonuclease [Herbaspirillum huttiense]|uniref:HNH endonuclease n=1 Tax=Herbaspirillum huttiense TaxID=863372 RepID=UPI001AC7893B|nr:HNH endonuclease [Herbaspirillum huttiense]MBN9357445.1 HNH endonuclease [Herbaspirillum huttiense]